MTMMTGADEFENRKRHYGRRKGWKLRPHQAQLMDTLLPQLTLVPETGRAPLTYFDPGVTDVWLEVGFGGGEHLFWQAEKNPHVGLIGAEPFIAGAAKLLSKIGDDRIRNIRLYTEDAGDIIRALPDSSLGRVFILHPDPWPKTRHHKRRFIQTEMLDHLARVMKPGAELRFATDDESYKIYALERMIAHPLFRWTAQGQEDWRVRPDDWPQTRYEAKALREGRTCLYLKFVRR